MRKLKQHGDGGVTVVGGNQTTRLLLLARVVDALTLTSHPAVTPEGRRLFDDSVPLTRLRMLDRAIISAGNAELMSALRD